MNGPVLCLFSGSCVVQLLIGRESVSDSKNSISDAFFRIPSAPSAQPVAIEEGKALEILTIQQQFIASNGLRIMAHSISSVIYWSRGKG